MRRFLLIAFQSLLAIVAFGVSSYLFFQRGGEAPTTAVLFRWTTIVCFFLIGVLAVVLAGRHLLKLGPAYMREGREDRE